LTIRYYGVKGRWPFIKVKKGNSESGLGNSNIIGERADASNCLGIKNMRKAVELVCDVSTSVTSVE
jgi:hypothetical protein